LWFHRGKGNGFARKFDATQNKKKQPEGCSIHVAVLSHDTRLGETVAFL
jgi:hypothetical protein